MVANSAMPYTNATNMVIDSGDFPRMMDLAMDAHDWLGFATRRDDARARGKLAGRGLAMYIEHTGRNEFTETVDISVSGAGPVTVFSGTQEMGQGLKTSYVQLVAERLQIDPARITIIQGDTDLVATGGGSGGSRSLYVGGSATVASTDVLIEEGRRLAADALESAAADLEFANGRFTIAGTDRSIDLFELAAAQPDGIFAISETTTSGDLTWPNGCHVCEVEIDPDTGKIALTRFTAVDDVGTVVNHVIVDGQVHGGVAQGSARRYWNGSPMTATARSCRARSWTTPCRAPTMCRSTPWSPTKHHPARPISSAQRGPANAVLPARRRRSSAPCATR